jgi:hypothetical protein
VYLSDHLIRRDTDGNEYVTDRDFIELLENEEAQERERVSNWSRRHGRLMPVVKTAKPALLARAALEKRIGQPPSKSKRSV